jgi:hypothetical protein
MLLKLLCKMLSASSTYISLAYSLVSFISGLWRVSLAEYILILRVFSHLLEAVMYHGYCKNWMTPAVVAECDHGHGPSELSCI